MPFRQLKSFLKILIGVQYKKAWGCRCFQRQPLWFCGMNKQISR